MSAGERADAIPDAACEAYLQAATGPPDDATVFERVRRGLTAAAPFLRAAHPEAGSEEAEQTVRLVLEAFQNFADQMGGDSHDRIGRQAIEIAIEYVGAEFPVVPEADRAPEDRCTGEIVGVGPGGICHEADCPVHGFKADRAPEDER